MFGKMAISVVSRFDFIVAMIQQGLVFNMSRQVLQLLNLSTKLTTIVRKQLSQILDIPKLDIAGLKSRKMQYGSRGTKQIPHLVLHLKKHK
jgi:hypothetical protein